MATINMTFDTKTKECVVILDGQALERVTNLYLYKYDDEARIEISVDESTDKDMRRYSTIVANNSDKAQNMEKSVASKDETLVKIADVRSVKEAIAEALKR